MMRLGVVLVFLLFLGGCAGGTGSTQKPTEAAKTAEPQATGIGTEKQQIEERYEAAGRELAPIFEAWLAEAKARALRLDKGRRAPGDLAADAVQGLGNHRDRMIEIYRGLPGQTEESARTEVSRFEEEITNNVASAIVEARALKGKKRTRSK